MMDYELEIVKGYERIKLVCEIADRRIKKTKRLLGIPDIVENDEYIVQKSEENIELVTVTVTDINRMLNLELINVGVRVATDQQVRHLVDDIRSKLAELTQILGKGLPVSEIQPVEEINDGFPIVISAISIFSILISIIVVFIAIDSD